MKGNKKLIITLTALVLAVVGAISAVTYVLSATLQHVTVSSLQVTYTANNVSATVELKGASQSGNLAVATSGTTSVTFTPAAPTSTETLTGPTVSLGDFIGTTFQRYAVYQFRFTNNYEAGHGASMYVTMTGSYSGTNVYVAYQVSESASCPDVEAALSDTDFTSFGTNWKTTVPAKFNVAQAGTKYVYMLVAIDDATTGITYNNTAIGFDLSNA